MRVMTTEAIHGRQIPVQMFCPQLFTAFMAGKAEPAPGTFQQASIVAGMRIMTATALPVAEGWVADLILLPTRLVTGETDLITGRTQQVFLL